MKKYKVELDCPNCANLLKNEVSRIKGIKSCDVNFTLKEMTVEFEDGVDENAVMNEARELAHELDDDFEIYF